MRFGRFAVVGVLNTVIDFLAFNALTLGFGMHVAPANVISYSLGIANSFVWNRNWTFRDRRGEAIGPEATRFVVANLGGLVVNTALVWIAVSAYGLLEGRDVLSLPEQIVLPLSKGFALVGSMLFNYLVFHSWVFVGGRERS